MKLGIIVAVAVAAVTLARFDSADTCSTAAGTVCAPVVKAGVLQPVVPIARAGRAVVRSNDLVARRSAQRKGHAGVTRRHRRAQPLPPRFTTNSLYERTTRPRVLRLQGCRAGRRRTHGIVVLDFGVLAHNGRSYGTILFSNRFASNRSITWAMKSYALGYVRCLPRVSRARITLARGTSNYYTYLPSHYRAGRRWAAHTMGFGKWLRRHGLAEHVRAAAADDAEPAWDPGFARTRAFFRGYESARTGHLLYNYGSLDGGVGHIWSLRQAFYVSGGMKYARALPEIYYASMARQWAELSRLAVHRYGRPVPFAGLMTQHWRGCGRCGFRPHEARRALMRELARHPRTRVERFGGVTNIVSIDY